MMTRRIVSLISILLLFGTSAGVNNLALETNDIADHVLSTNINFFFDLFLSHYKKKLIEENKTEIEVGGFEERFSTKILSLKFAGAIVVNDGWCRNLSTIHRTGEADMDRINDNVVLTAHMGMGDLKIDYNNYDISLMGVHQKGKIHVTIGTNSLWLKLNVQFRPSCSVSLADLKIEQLDDIRVDISNLGIFENMTDDITSWVIKEVTKWYGNYIEATLYPELSKVVKDADLCHYIPF